MDEGMSSRSNEACWVQCPFVCNESLVMFNRILRRNRVNDKMKNMTWSAIKQGLLAKEPRDRDLYVGALPLSSDCTPSKR